MVKDAVPSIRIDLNEFKLHIDLKKESELTLHFNSPSRMFYLSVIALVVNEMKKSGKVSSIPLEKHFDLLVLLNESVGGSAGSSDKKNLLARIYKKWKDALPNLEEAPLYKILGRKKEYDEGADKTYVFTETVKDSWANLFEYKGSDENVRLKFSIDKIGVRLDDVVIVYEDALDGDAWERFLINLKRPTERAPEIVTVPSSVEAPAIPVSPISGQKSVLQSRKHWAVLVIAIVIIAGVAALAIWKLHLNPAPLEVASIDKMVFPLTNKPSIAVLPFVNMSEDPRQEYFSDGITEDLITDLSKISGLLVIARNSTFAYKGKYLKIKQVAEELGVRYVLEGSVRKAGDEIRINAQLVDALSGNHLWAERYDGKMDRIFALQDQITQKIVSALAVKLTRTEKEQASQKGTENIAAYDAFLRGWDHYHRWTADDFGKAVVFFKKAVELDPNYGEAYAALARIYITVAAYPEFLTGLNLSWVEARLRAVEYTQMALKRPTALAYADASVMYSNRRQYQEAISEAKRGLALDPNNPVCLNTMGWALTWAGRPREGIEYFNKWIRVDPRDRFVYLRGCGFAHFYLGNIAEAANLLEQALKLEPEGVGVMTMLAACYSLLGRDQDARAILDQRRKNPAGGPTVTSLMFLYPFKDRAVVSRFAESLIKAGLPPGFIAGGYRPAFPENRLTGAEIKTLLFGSKITGIDPPSGRPWWMDYKKDGKLAWRGPGPISADTGRSRMEGDMICTQHKNRHWGLEACATVFRNPGGKYETKDEYFFCADYGFGSFSLAK